MGCSCLGISAIVFNVLAIIFTAIALGLPYWSTNDESAIQIPALEKNISAINITEATFAAGVWGICTDVNFKNQVQNITDGEHSECFLYYTNKKVKLFSNEVNDNNDEVFINDDKSLCAIHDNIDEEYPTIEGIPKEMLDEFLEKTCGSIGKASLASSVIGIGLGCFTLVLLILGVTCCKKSSCFIWLAGAILCGAGAFTLFSFVIWVAQSQALRDISGTNYSVSFFLAVIGFVFYLISAGLTFAHVRKGKAEESMTGL